MKHTRDRNRRVVGVGALATALSLGLVGCASDPTQGYAFKSAHSDSIRTVSVPMFDNTTYATGLENELTDAVIKEIQRTTKWAVVSSGAADTELAGTITDAQLRRLSVRTSTGLVQEMAYLVRVDFEFRDNRTGKPIVTRRSFDGLDTFTAAIPTGERLEAGQAGTVQRVARDLVAELRESW